MANMKKTGNIQHWQGCDMAVTLILYQWRYKSGLSALKRNLAVCYKMKDTYRPDSSVPAVVIAKIAGAHQ